MIVALAGRRIDRANDEEVRFPLELKDEVSSKIRSLFQKNHVRVLVSSAACGADLLAQEEARKLNIERHIILPVAQDKFRKTSVIDRPGDWGPLFDEICDEVHRKGNLIILEGFEENEKEGYSATTLELLAHAERLRSKDEDILAIAVGKGRVKEGSDETARFVELAELKNIKVAEIPIITQKGGQVL